MREGYKSMLEQSKTTRSVLTSYVRNLQQRRPGVGNEGPESQSWRKGRVQNDSFFTKYKDLVGRENELQTLRDCYNRVVTLKATEVTTIHGPSGAGKSALVRSFFDSLPEGAFHMEGRFNQLQSRAPYVALAAASDQFCRQIMRRENSIELRNRIRAVLGPDVSLLGNLVPTLAEMTTEDGNSDQHTGSSGAQLFTRFKLLFRALLRCVASPATPIVFFLDDLQWADDASMEVLKTILTDGQSHCIMLLCSYRMGEITADRLRQYGLAERKQYPVVDDLNCSTHNSQITDICVDCLDCDSLNTLLSSTLGIDALVTQSLSTLLWNKTNGNPFHALNFLDMLFRNGMLSKESDDTWTWDEDLILRATNVADNLVDILASRMQDLPEQVQSILQIAAFIGHDFPAAALVMIVHEEQDMLQAEYSFERHSKDVIHKRIVAALQMAVAAGLLETMPEPDYYKFAHAKIQEVLYETLMPDAMERQLLHQRIGSLIWDSVRGMPMSQIDDWYIFLAADNLNRAIGLVDYSGTRFDLIELNLTSAKRAIEKAAFVTAADYLQIALTLLREDSSLWDNRYDMCMDVLITAAETEMNRGMFSESNAILKEIHARATSLREHAAAHAIEMDSLTLQGDLKGSVLLVMKVLQQLGVHVPRKINLFVVAKELCMAKAAMGRRALSELLHLPEMTDTTMILAFGLMNAMAINCYILGGSLKATYAVISLRMLRLTLKFGMSPLYSPATFFAWGSVHAFLGDFETSHQAEILAFNVINKYGVESERASMVVYNYGMNHFWRNMLDSNARREVFVASYAALSYGHVFVAQTGFIGWVAAGLYLDDPLSEVITTTRRVVPEMTEFQSKSTLMFVLPIWQVFLNICGDASNTNPANLRGEAVDDEFTMYLEEVDSKVGRLNVSLCKVILAFVYEDWDSAKKNLPIIGKYRAEMDGYFTIGFLLTWSAACHYDVYRTDGISKHKREARRAHRKVDKWATTGTEMLVGVNSFLHAMESLCVKREPIEQVEIMFEEAASACAVGRCRFFEALSNERLARLYLRDKPNATKRSLYLKRAAALYRSWGAVAKAALLENQYEYRRDCE